MKLIGKTILTIAIASTLGCGDEPEGSEPDDASGTGGGSGTTGFESDGTSETDGATEGATAATSFGDTHGGGSGTGGWQCTPTAETHVIDEVPPSIMLVLDKSGSMAWSWDHDADPMTPSTTKWSSLHDVVAYVAFTSAIDHLTTQEGESRKYVILVTDGAANCKDGEDGADMNLVYDDTLPIRVAEARETHQIVTYAIGVDMVDEVISAPNTNPWQRLNEVAQAGGAAKAGTEAFYNCTSLAELSQAMGTITGSLECTVALDEAVEFPDLVTAEVDGTEVAKVADCSSENGWTFTSETAPYAAVVLCGTACSPDGVANEVAIHQGCPD